MIEALCKHYNIQTDVFKARHPATTESLCKHYGIQTDVFKNRISTNKTITK